MSSKPVQRLLKRLMDIAGAAVGLVLCAPVLFITARRIKKELGSPVFYNRQRAGQFGRPFMLYKFRTMTDARNENGKLLPDAERLTPLGQKIRSSSIDELPQLWNVLVGDMSLVGPRPALYNQDDLVALRTEAGVQRLRPGVTGWAQINGRDELPIPEKVRLDREYLDRMSLAFDVRIILATAAAAVSGRGVSH